MRIDNLKWFAIGFLFLAGVVINYFYSDFFWALRIVGWLVLSLVLLGIMLQTTQGKKTLVFFRESYIELRKVHWPTRQETIQVTFLVLLVVVILAMMLWGVDGVLIWLMGWLTGQRS